MSLPGYSYLLGIRQQILDNCVLFSKVSSSECLSIILKRGRQGTYEVVVLRHGELGKVVLVSSERAVTPQEAFEDVLGKSMDAVGKYIDMHGIEKPLSSTRDGLNASNQGGPNDNDNSDDDDETCSITTSSSTDEKEGFHFGRLGDSMVDSLEHVEYQTDTTSVGDENEASGGGYDSARADGVPVATRLGNIQVGPGTSHADLPRYTAADSKDNHTHARGHGGPHFSNFGSELDNPAWMRSRMGSTAIPAGAMRPGSSIAGQGTGDGQARRTATMPAGIPPQPARPRSGLPVKAQLRDQGRPATHGTSGPHGPPNNAFPVRPTAVNSPTSESPSVTSASKFRTLAAAARPSMRLGDPIRCAIMRNTNAAEWNYRLAITSRRQPRGVMAKNAPAGTTEHGLDPGFREAVLVLRGRTTRYDMRAEALRYIRDHVGQFDRWLDVRGRPEGRGPSREVNVARLRTTVTQAVFDTLKMQSSGAPVREQEVLDIENYKCEDLRGLVSNRCADWHMAGMGQIEWLPLFEIVVSNM